MATERAFLMVAVMLGAILADRRALSLRTVALAAVVILALAPEALLTPGFQMSFAATVALIVIYPPWLRLGRHLPWYLRPVVMLVVTSVVAGMATSPIAAVHFGRVAHFGVLANLLVVPVTGVLIMPMGPIAAVLAPIGLDGPALWLMGLGTRWMLGVGGWIAGLDGAVSYVTQPGPLVLPLLGVGAVVAVLCWRSGRPAWRNLCSSAGVGLLAVAFALWLGAGRPEVLISAQGDAVGVMGASGRALSKAKGGSFTVGEWLEKDGDIATQPEAAARPGWQGPVKQRFAAVGTVELLHLTGKGSAEAARVACAAGRIIVTDQPVEARPKGDCLLLDAAALRRSGAIALHWEGDGLRRRNTREVTGDRPWSY